MAKNEIAHRARVHTRLALSETVERAIEDYAFKLALETLEDADVKARLKAIVLKAFDQAWEEMTRDERAKKAPTP
jgi:hypothetical protein